MKNTTFKQRKEESKAILALSPFWERIPKEDREEAVEVMALDMLIYDQTSLLDRGLNTKNDSQSFSPTVTRIKRARIQKFERFPFMV